MKPSLLLFLAYPLFADGLTPFSCLNQRSNTLSHLCIYSDVNPTEPEVETHDRHILTSKLQDVGIRFELWTAYSELSSDATEQDVLKAMGEKPYSIALCLFSSAEG